MIIKIFVIIVIISIMLYYVLNIINNQYKNIEYIDANALKTGDICLYSSDSNIIKFATLSKFTHIGIVIKKPHDKNNQIFDTYVYHISKDNIPQIDKLSHINNKENDLHILQINKSIPFDHIYDVIFKYKNVIYDTNIITTYISKHVSKNVKKYIDPIIIEDKQYICSTLIHDVLTDLNVTYKTENIYYPSEFITKIKTKKPYMYSKIKKLKN